MWAGIASYAHTRARHILQHVNTVLWDWRTLRRPRAAAGWLVSKKPLESCAHDTYRRSRRTTRMPSHQARRRSTPTRSPPAFCPAHQTTAPPRRGRRTPPTRPAQLHRRLQAHVLPVATARHAAPRHRHRRSLLPCSRWAATPRLGQREWRWQQQQQQQCRCRLVSPSSLVQFFPVSQYLLERSLGAGGGGDTWL